LGTGLFEPEKLKKVDYHFLDILYIKISLPATIVTKEFVLAATGINCRLQLQNNPGILIACGKFIMA
jgi:hypothetical protein